MITDRKSPETVLAFGNYRLDERRSQLLCDGVVVPLPHKAFSLLRTLARRAGEVVGRDELAKLVWEDKPISDATVTQHIFMLRSVLKERSHDGLYIATVPRHGYRFIAPVREVAKSESDFAFHDPEVYRALIKGRYYLERSNEEGFNDALGCFREALALDPNSALGHVGMANAYYDLASYQYCDPAYGFGQARRAALRAVEIDPALYDAERILGAIHLWHDWDFERAAARISHALLLNSIHAPSLNAATWLSIATVQLDKALRNAQSALLLNPSSLRLQATLGIVYQCLDEPLDAVRHFRTLLDMDENFSLARYYLGSALLQLGSIEDGLRELQSVVQVDRSVQSLSSLAYAYAIHGDLDQAEDMLQELYRLAKTRYVSSYSIAIPLVGLKRFNEALTALKFAEEERAPWMILLPVEPRFDALRDNPDFQKLLRVPARQTATTPSDKHSNAGRTARP
ncbi:MAG: winged helix-turn-helix domain-containing protein [Candidatus Eremiobacteraeota bacterium]|nr:winged helix-turn-helix domain-containing protein [Candidatus Eremiobacteraeota bacterium]